jgi:L-rhamnose-H+ transport protein
MAVLAGVFSCLPNVGMAFGSAVTEAAQSVGIRQGMAENAVWPLFFSAGFVVNCAYCLGLSVRNENLKGFISGEFLRNLCLAGIMALLWIASFYLYGMGAAKLGKWGVILAWPLFITLSIITGNLWGLWRGEWAGASNAARSALNRGFLLLLLAVGLIAAGNLN